ncbi:unnamed protein product [Enterobius vermicularis]|uniref:LRRNT domain-containing protein n=1 Tax=Enterobius vermicularis TaxID=51028 RepID=A0A0N4VKU8_ENTVE|nr:unnamed protein product [Enterobius vermicularis]
MILDIKIFFIFTTTTAIAVSGLYVKNVPQLNADIPQEVRKYFSRNTGQPTWFTCPVGCYCTGDLSQNSSYELAVRCYGGNLSHSVFAKIIKDSPQNITMLSVEAPSNEPNHFLWDDNLNRFKNLRILRLISCGIPALSYSISLKELEVLDLRSNNIEEISIDMFTDLPKLKTLDLSSNRLRVLPTGVFAFLHRMERLSLAYNNITELPINLLHQHRRLKVLHLDGNKISLKNLNSFFRDTQQLERLELNHCGLQQYWELKLEYLTNLQRLGLAGNQLGEIPTMLFRGHHRLQAIDLSDNDIRQIPIDPLWHSNITQLVLACNRLGNLEQLKNVETYGPLEHLDISYNNFETFKSEMLGAAQKTVEVLNLSGNRLRYVDSRLTDNLTALKVLHLADNQLVELPSDLPAIYSALRLLNISQNALYSLPYGSARIFQSLKILDISRNRFYTLQASLMEDFLNSLDKVS